MFSYLKVVSHQGFFFFFFFFFFSKAFGKLQKKIEAGGGTNFDFFCWQLLEICPFAEFVLLPKELATVNDELLRLTGLT